MDPPPAAVPPGLDAEQELHLEPPAVHAEPPALHAELPDLHAEPPDLHAEPPDLHAEPPDLHSEPPDLDTEPPDLHMDPSGAPTQSWDALAEQPAEAAPLAPDAPAEPSGAGAPAPVEEVRAPDVGAAPDAGAAPDDEPTGAGARRRRSSAAEMPPRAGIPPLPPLPPLPPRLAGRGAGGPGAGGRRRLLARGGAVVALVGVVVALVLVARPLFRSGRTTTTVKVAPALKVLIPEGKTRLQIAEIAAADGLLGSYRAASRHSSLLDPSSYGAPAGTPDLEGFLFPDTFDIDRGAPVSELVEAQLTDFRSRFGASQIAAARALHETPYQLLTVASMVEREAQIPADRPRIAAVIYNRLSQGMPLGIDATIYYAVELKSGVATYTHELTEAQLHIDSPYNTRLHTGLPPTPISNPGLASIEAAAHPAHVPYLYYVAGADGCGEQVFSTTAAQFEVNAAAYHAAVARNGGHPPACRKK